VKLALERSHHALNEPPTRKGPVRRLLHESTNLSDAGIQQFLAIWVALLMLICLVLFAITNNAAVLVATTVVGIPASIVYNHYFRKK
jgi:hypothetical protein